MNNNDRLKLIEAQLRCAENSLNIATANMAKVAGCAEWVISYREFKRLVLVQIKLQDIHAKLAEHNRWADYTE